MVTQQENKRTTKSLVNEDPFAPVRLDNIKHDGRVTDKFMVTMQKPDSENYVEIPGVNVVHSEDYKLVSNQEVADMAEGVMSATGMNFAPVPTFGGGHSAPIFWNGRRFCQRWYTEDVKVKVPSNKHDHNSHEAFALGLQVDNSYDGSAKIGFTFFGMFMLCSNQFHAATMLGEPFTCPHVNRGESLDADFDAAKTQLVERAESFAEVLPVIEGLQETRVTGLSGFLDLRQKLKTATGVDTRDRAWLDELSGTGISRQLELSQDTYTNYPDTYWAIANAYTAITTHGVGGTRGAGQSARVLDFMIKDAEIEVPA
jgi:hypothetical protein